MNTVVNAPSPAAVVTLSVPAARVLQSSLGEFPSPRFAGEIFLVVPLKMLRCPRGTLLILQPAPEPPNVAGLSGHLLQQPYETDRQIAQILQQRFCREPMRDTGNAGAAHAGSLTPVLSSRFVHFLPESRTACARGTTAFLAVRSTTELQLWPP